MIQWLILHASIAEGAGSILGQGSSACLIVPSKTKKKKKKILVHGTTGTS